MESLDEIGLKYINNYGELETSKHYKGGDKTSKGQGFTKRYDELFSGIRERPVNLLELGVHAGRSIAMWSDYFPNGHIYGVDIHLSTFGRNEKELKKLGFNDDNVTLLEADLLEEGFMKQIGDWPKFNIIIDDANHNSKPQFQNFMNLFPRLEQGGIYVIEDIIKPGGVFQLFGDIFTGLANKKHKSMKNNKFAQIARMIDHVEIRSNNIIFFRV